MSHSNSHSRREIGWIALMLCGLFGCGPFVLLPGGQLSGQPTPVPDDWSFLADVDTVQLESRPSDPYSVNIWAVGIGADVYVHAGANRAAWIEHMEADPRVRMRVGEAIYELRSTRVESASEFSRFANVWEEKYGSRPRNENISEIYVMRLSAR